MELKKIRTIEIMRRAVDINIPDAEITKALKQSIISNGQTEAIKVRTLSEPLETGEKYEIIDGLKIFNVIKQLAEPYIWCIDLGVMTDTQALKLYTQHNIVKYELNAVTFAETVEKLSATYPPASLEKFLHIDRDRIKTLMRLNEFDWENFKSAEETEQKQQSLF